MGNLNISIEQPDKNVVILRLSGEFEGYAALDNKEQLLKCASEKSVGTLMIDLGGIEYIDSAALGILLEMSKICEKKKVQFGLVNVHDPVKKVIEVTKLDKVLKIFKQ